MSYVAKARQKKVLKVNFYQVFTNPSIYLSIIGVVLLFLFSTWEYVVSSQGDISVANLVELFIGLSMPKKLIVLLAGIPYVASFCSDYNCQYLRPFVIRSGINKYIRSKVITCFTVAFLVSFLGFCLSIAVFSLKCPLFPTHIPVEEFASGVFASLATSFFPLSFVLVQAFIFSLAAAMWVVVGLTVSAFIPNRFVAVATPLLASYIIEEVTQRLPSFLNLYSLTRGSDVLNRGALLAFIYPVLLFVCLSILAGLLFSYQVKRRIRNEVI